MVGSPNPHQTTSLSVFFTSSSSAIQTSSSVGSLSSHNLYPERPILEFLTQKLQLFEHRFVIFRKIVSCRGEYRYTTDPPRVFVSSTTSKSSSNHLWVWVRMASNGFISCCSLHSAASRERPHSPSLRHHSGYVKTSPGFSRTALMCGLGSDFISFINLRNVSTSASTVPKWVGIT